MTNEDERAQSMAILRQQMRRIPQSVHSGSVQVVRQFKEWYVMAEKAVSNRASTTLKLSQLINQYDSFK